VEKAQSHCLCLHRQFSHYCILTGNIFADKTDTQNKISMLFPTMELEKIYFFTATILNWRKLLAPDKYKQMIVDSLKHLVDKQKIAVYAFVVMPNHIHLYQD
jgi:hypothetical protein